MSAYYYDVVTIDADGNEDHHDLGTESALRAGDVIPLTGGDWLIEKIEARAGFDGRPLVTARAARYRIRMRHPDGTEDGGSFADTAGHRPDVGYTFTTGTATGWTVVERTLEHDANGQPYVELVAEQR